MLYDVFIGKRHIGQVYADAWSQVVVAPGSCVLVLNLVAVEGEKRVYKPVM